MSKNSVRAVLIIGMHRSGTSCLTGELQARGLWLGDVSTRNPHNLKGNREHPIAVSINEETLLDQDSSWDRPCTVSRFSAEQKKRAEDFLAQLASGAQKVGVASMGFKDPRSTYTLEAWLNCTTKARISTAVIASYRHPVLVARSLSRRNKWPLEQGLALWQQYNQRLLEIAQRHPLSLVNFDASTGDYAKAINSAAERLGISVNNDPLQFFSSELRHTDQVLTIPAALMATYEQLCALTSSTC